MADVRKHDPTKQPLETIPLNDDHENGKMHMGADDGVERNLAQDPEMEGLTLFEKKALLVNRELNAQGMGRYQWAVFFLCGFGYFLDLLWAQAFGLAVTPMQTEFGFDAAALGNIFSSFSAGLTAGAFVWGVLVDIVGRWWAFNCTVLIATIFGLCLGAPDTYNAVIVLTAFVGIGIGGNIPIDTTICLEFLPHNRRWLLPCLSIFQPLGVVICSAIAYGFIPKYSCPFTEASCNNVPAGTACCHKADNMGWRYLMFTLGGITLAVFIGRFVIFNFQESPKFLLSRGQDEKAVKVLQNVAKFNRRQCGVTLEMFTALSDDRSSASSGSSRGELLGSGSALQNISSGARIKLELERFKILFNSFNMARLVILIWVTYMFDYWGFTIAGSFLPTIIAKKGTQLGLTLNQTYLSYIYIYIFGIPGVLLGGLIYGWRWISLLVSSALFGASLFIFTVVNSQASYIGINGLVYFFQSMFNAILYGWTPEAFPAPIRGTAAGIASFWGRIMSIIAPIAAAHVLATSTNGVLYMAGGGVFVCTVCIALLPRKLVGATSY